jgi:hypothetical protein
MIIEAPTVTRSSWSKLVESMDFRFDIKLQFETLKTCQQESRHICQHVWIGRFSSAHFHIWPFKSTHDAPKALKDLRNVSPSALSRKYKDWRLLKWLNCFGLRTLLRPQDGETYIFSAYLHSCGSGGYSTSCAPETRFDFGRSIIVRSKEMK